MTIAFVTGSPVTEFNTTPFTDASLFSDCAHAHKAAIEIPDNIRINRTGALL
jgi:hypothetical protein